MAAIPSTPKKQRTSGSSAVNIFGFPGARTCTTVPVNIPSTPQKLHPQKPKSDWTTPTRAKVKVLLESGESQSRISELTGVPQPTISRWKKEGAASRRNAGVYVIRGRPKKLDKHDIRRLIAKITSSYQNRVLSWTKLAEDCGLRCSGYTVKRALNLVGYHRCKACKKPFISEKCRKDRTIYSNEYLHKSKEFWRPHLYIDECNFNTSARGSVWVTRLPGERYHKQCIQNDYASGSASVMICGGISYNWKSPLIFLEATLKPTRKKGEYKR